MHIEGHRHTKEAIVLSKMIRPSADAAEKTLTSQTSAGVVRRSRTFGIRVPETLVRSAEAIAIKDANVLVQICGDPTRISCW